MKIVWFYGCLNIYLQTTTLKWFTVLKKMLNIKRSFYEINSRKWISSCSIAIGRWMRKRIYMIGLHLFFVMHHWSCIPYLLSSSISYPISCKPYGQRLPCLQTYLMMHFFTLWMLLTPGLKCTFLWWWILKSTDLKISLKSKTKARGLYASPTN